MKNKDIKELQQKTMPELKKLLKEKQAGLLKLKMDVASRKIKNVRAVIQGRHDVARIMTFLQQNQEEKTK